MGPVNDVAAVNYRRATLADLGAEHAVFCRATGPLMRAHNYAWEDPPFDRFEPGLRHLLVYDAERCWVAEVAGEVVGYTAATIRDDTWFFSMLFIDPQAQGRRIGRALFELASEGAPPRRLTITDSIQPISNALYGRHGLLPLTPLLPMRGESRVDKPSGLELGDPSPGDLAAVDRAAYEFERGVDHAYWASQGQRRGWYRHGELVAYSYRWPDGRIGPLAGVDPETAAAALRAELMVNGPVTLEIPGSARALLRTALEAGLRIEPPMGLLLGSDGVNAPTALAISTYGFF
ncbi:MAG TPA: GNAT family N-acetyltransferase [Methylomirabilota bacterium]|nr:GNAT family N-acetyltransferase [Methylomirabilota bacterium]